MKRRRRDKYQLSRIDKTIYNYYRIGGSDKCISILLSKYKINEDRKYIQDRAIKLQVKMNPEDKVRVSGLKGGVELQRKRRERRSKEKLVTLKPFIKNCIFKIGEKYDQ